MSDKLISGLPAMDLSKLDFSYTFNLASGVQASIEENNRRTMAIVESATENRRKMQDAIEQTAVNTSETNNQLQKVIGNQLDYIDILKEQLSIQKEQLESDEKQLAILKNIFASGEDGVSVEKEIMRMIQEQIKPDHPLWDYFKDKGGDVAVGIGTPIIYNALKLFLLSQGIQLP